MSFLIQLFLTGQKKKMRKMINILGKIMIFNGIFTYS